MTNLKLDTHKSKPADVKPNSTASPNCCMKIARTIDNHPNTSSNQQSIHMSKPAKGIQIKLAVTFKIYHKQFSSTLVQENKSRGQYFARVKAGQNATATIIIPNKISSIFINQIKYVLQKIRQRVPKPKGKSQASGIGTTGAVTWFSIALQSTDKLSRASVFRIWHIKIVLKKLTKNKVLYLLRQLN